MNSINHYPGTLPALLTDNVSVFVGAPYVRKTNGVVKCFRGWKRIENRLCCTRIVSQKVRRRELEAFDASSAHQETRVHDDIGIIA